MGFTVNGQAPSWHQTEMSYGGEEGGSKVFGGLTAISWGHGVAITNNYGDSSVEPIHSTQGAHTYDESTMSLYRATWDRIKGELSAGKENGWMGKFFQVVIKYRFGTGPISTTTIEGRLMHESESLAVGDDAIQDEVTFMPQRIVTKAGN